jgi:transcription factor S
MVKFCPKCEKLLRRKRIEGKSFLKCTACDYMEEEASDIKGGKKKISAKLAKKIAKEKTLVVGEKDELHLMPTTKVECPKCGHPEAEYEQFQTRSADEPATTFYGCLKCRHRWREY